MARAGILLRVCFAQDELVEWVRGAPFLRGAKMCISAPKSYRVKFDNWDLHVRKYFAKFSICESAEQALESTTLGLSIGWPRKLAPQEFNLPAHGTFNLHHGFRLKYRGRHMQTWAIRNRETHHGTTLHKMDSQIDHGPIVDSRLVAVDPCDTSYSLTRRCDRAAIEVLNEWIPKLLKSPDFIPVDPHPSPKVHTEAQLSHEIKTNCSAEDFDRQVRALTFPGMPKPYVQFRGKKWHISP